MENTELQEKVESLEQAIQRLKQDANNCPDISRESQLTFPLDPRSQRLIEDITIYPISVRLKNTDAATAANYGVFFVAERQYSVLAVAEVHGTAGSDASAVTLQIERLQGTTAPDSGNVILSTAFDLKGTANTVQYGSLVTTGVTALQRGDRLCLKDAGVMTAVANLCVTVYIQPA